MSKGSRECDSRKGLNSERKATVRSWSERGECLEARDKRRRSAEEEASEIASARRRLGRRPSLLAMREEGVRDRLDLRTEGRGDEVSESGSKSGEIDGVSIGRFSLREEDKGGVINRRFSPIEEGVNVEGKGGVIFGRFSPGEEGAIVTEGEEGEVGGEGGSADSGDVTQLGGAPGSMEMVVPGRRSTGC